MSGRSWFKRKNPSSRIVTEEERISRYIYLLNTLPASVIETAHAKAFKDLPPETRREMFDQLRPFMSETEQTAASDDPTVLARLVRRAEEHRARRAVAGGQGEGATSISTAIQTGDPRDVIDPRTMMLDAGIMASVASGFMMSGAITTYYTSGEGSLLIGNEPAWVGATFDPSQAGYGDGFAGADFGGGFGGAAPEFGGFGGDGGGGGGGDGGGGG